MFRYRASCDRCSSSHDGQDPYAFVSTIDGCRLMSCAAAAKAWSTLGELLDSGDLAQPAESKDGKVKPVWWNKRWLPFADAGGDMLCLDLDPAPGGTVGQVLRFYHDEGWRDSLAPSLEAFLERVGSPKPIPWRSGPLESPGPAPVRAVRYVTTCGTASAARSIRS